VAGSAVAALILLYVVYVRVQHYTLACRVETLQSEFDKLHDAALLPDTKKTRDAAAPIAKWMADDTVWLDKLLALSEHFPPAQDAILYELTFSVRQNEVQVGLRGAARDAGIIAKMEEQARVHVGRIAPRSSGQDLSAKEYPWRFDDMVKLERGRKP
jgi:hypothetical protein